MWELVAIDISSKIKNISPEDIIVLIGSFSLVTICVDIFWRVSSDNWPPNWLDLWGKVTYLSFSLLIGAGVLNLLFETAKKNQWCIVRMLTYKQILYLLGWIAMSFLDENPLISESDPDYASIDELTDTIVNGFTHIRKDTVADTVKAYRDLQEKMYSIIETKNNGLRELENKKQWDDVAKFIDYLDELSLHLYPIKFVLIPRVFMLSGSEKICNALTKLDARLLLYEQDINSHRKSAREKGAMYPTEIAALMYNAADIYEAICDDLTLEEMAEWRNPDEDKTENQEEPAN